MSTLLKLSRVEAGAVSGDLHCGFSGTKCDITRSLLICRVETVDLIGYEEMLDVGWWHGHGQLSPLQHCCHVAQALCELPAGSGSQC